MSNFILCNDLSINNEQIIDCINPVGTFITKNKKTNFLQIYVSYLQNSLLKGDFIYEDETWVAVFCGDLIGKGKMDFPLFIHCLENQNFSGLSEIEGLYSFAAFNKKTNKYYLIADFRSQYPVFYCIQNNKIIFSTSLSSFVRILDKVVFDKEWLYDYLYFNFPINNQTFLKNVFRMPAGSVLEVDPFNNKKIIHNYAPFFEVSEPLIKDKQALELAKEVCKERFPLYYFDGDNFACALTGGWDGRTCLALAPDYKKVTAYTYGIAGCNDLIEGERTARLAGINHFKILFDEKFVDELPNYIYENVFSSSGLQNVLRSTLLYVYKQLYNHSPTFPATISGVGLDNILRGHLGPLVGTSKDMGEINRTGIVYFNDNFWDKIIKEDYNEFKDFILSELNEMKKIYGNYNDTRHHLLFHVYVASREYFSGELNIASNFTTFRVPGWDSEIVKLPFLINKGCISYSELAGYPRQGREAMEVQSYLLTELAPVFAKIPIRYATPYTILKGDLPYNISKNITLLKKKFKSILNGNPKRAPLEDWNQWLNYKHRKFADDVLSNKKSLIKNYISETYLTEIKNNRDIIMLGKLITIEIILQLIDNRWNRFWDVNQINN